jgi:hypothetical protein
MIRWQQEPHSMNPTERILAPLDDKTQRQIDTCSWGDYLYSPVWAAIKTWMFEAYGAASQLSGRNGLLEVHHNRPVHRGHERPKDLLILTNDEHADYSGNVLGKLEYIVEREESPEWKGVLEDYQAYLQEKDADEVRRIVAGLCATSTKVE